MNKILVKDWGIRPTKDKFNALNLRELLNTVRKAGNVILEFEEGEYHFYPDYAKEKLLYISNHDEDTIKKIAFDLTDFSNLKISGKNTHFVFHTEIIPFYLHNCDTVSIQGISMDYQRPSYSEGTILNVDSKTMVISIDRNKYPYFIKHNRIYFTGENFCHELACWLEMDQERIAPVYNGRDIEFNGPNSGHSTLWKEIEDGVAQVSLTDETQNFLETSRIGNKIILRHHPRNHPAIYITDSKNIVCSDINIYHATGMGLIAQFTENITLNNFNVTFNPNNKRIFTVIADSTHFVYCKGIIHISDCLFENQLDDAVNIHGIYFRVEQVLSDTEVIVELVHHQQKGVKIGEEGDNLALVNNKTMFTYDNVVIAEVRRLNKDYSYIKFDRPILNIKCGHVVENISYIPDVIIEKCKIQNNRARGILLTSAGKVIVRENYFKTSGAAILVEGDSVDWFESGATKDIVIENNIFDNCDYVTGWGYAPIQVSPSAQKIIDNERYHKKMVICSNKFKCFDNRLVYARNIEHIEFSNNIIEPSNDFPPISGKAFELIDILKFTETNNLRK